MTPHSIFPAVTYLAIAGWLALLVAPWWRPAARVVAAVLVPALLGAAYTAIVASRLGAGGEGGFGSLAEVAALFADPWWLLAGWIHYLAFDLFIGAWMARDALRQRFRWPLVVPCLLLVFLAGPAGLLLYLLARAAARRTLAVEDAP